MEQTKTDWNENCIYYGPIRFYRRRGKAPTLLTGRKSKFEQLSGEEQIQRELRREKNRLLSKKLKEKRENILNSLIEQIHELEKKHFYLLNNIEQLQLYKDNLSYKLEDCKQDSLSYLINQNQIPLFFEEYDHSSLDTDSLITNFTDDQLTIDQFLSP